MSNCQICETEPAFSTTNGIAHCRWENCEQAAANPFGIGDSVHVRMAPADELQGEIIREDAIDTQHRWAVKFPSGVTLRFAGDELELRK